MLAVGGFRTVTLWDLKTGRPAQVIEGLAGQVQSVAFNPAGTHLAVAGGEPGKAAQALIFDLADVTRRTFLLGHTDVVNHITWSADGKRLVTAGTDKIARIWAWPGGLVQAALRGHSDSVTRALFSPDSVSVYTGSIDRNIRRFETASGKLLKTYGGSGDAITALALSPDGKRLVSSGPENRIRWWNVDGNETFRFSDGSGEVNDLNFSKDGNLLISAGADKALRVWRAGDGGHARMMSGSAEWIFTTALSPDTKLAAAGCADGLVRIWESETVRFRVAVASEGSNWIAITPEGYFAGSPDWTRGIKPLLNGKAADAACLGAIRNLNVPDMILAALKPTDVKVAEIPATATKGK
jgi:WD40 repeat protein